MTAREEGLERYPTLGRVAGLSDYLVYHFLEALRIGMLPSDRRAKAYPVRENDDRQPLEEPRRAPIPERQQPGTGIDVPNEVRCPATGGSRMREPTDPGIEDLAARPGERRIEVGVFLGSIGGLIEGKIFRRLHSACGASPISDILEKGSA